MQIADKLRILTDSAKYDVSCASSGTKGQARGRMGSTSLGGICHAWSSDGRCISLLKILMTNACVYDCAYCINRRSNDIPRTVMTPEEIAALTVNFYRKNYIEGLFLSSAVFRSPDETMTRMIRALRLLREEHRFSGYIHAKIIPHSSPPLVEELGRLADRVSVNIELPSQKSLTLLAPQKNYPAILKPMQAVSTSILAHQKERRDNRRAPAFSPAGQSTQLIIGATPETDRQIMLLSSRLYQQMHLKRVYYSAYIPVNRGANLPALPGPPLLREHRLYQADWLIRLYHFSVEELFSRDQLNLDTALDPKVSWALRHLEHFPIEINKADYRTLLRIPGLGFRSAYKILRLRKVKSLTDDDLKKIGISLKRARYFITVNGHYQGGVKVKAETLRPLLAAPQKPDKDRDQYQLFDMSPVLRLMPSTVSGEL